jgi:phospholipase D1/2
MIGAVARSPLKRRKHPRKPAWGKIIAVVIVVAALAAAWRWTPLADYLTFGRIADWARWVREMPWAPAIAIAIYTPAAFILFPRPVLTLFTVIAFGPWLGFAYGMTGIMLSALATYYAGRIMRPDTVERLGGEAGEQVKKALRKHGVLAMFGLRIVAVAPFAVESIIAGAARVKVWEYSLGTFLGMAPGVLATTVFGNQIAAALEDVSKINYWIVGAVVVLFIAMTWAVKRWFYRMA